MLTGKRKRRRRRRAGTDLEYICCLGHKPLPRCRKTLEGIEYAVSKTSPPPNYMS